MDNGAWYPFGEDMSDKSGTGFDLSPNLNNISPRVFNLIKQNMAGFHAMLWPDCDCDGEDHHVNNRVSIVFFGADSDVMSKIDLDDWLESGFKEFGQTGDEEEIAALEKLKATCDRIIETRRENINKWAASRNRTDTPT